MSVPDEFPFRGLAEIMLQDLRETREELLREREFLSQYLSDWLTANEAAAYLKISQEALRSKVRRGEIPYHRTSARMIRFSRVELDAWVKASRSVDEPCA